MPNKSKNTDGLTSIQRQRSLTSIAGWLLLLVLIFHDRTVGRSNLSSDHSKLFYIAGRLSNKNYNTRWLWWSLLGRFGSYVYICFSFLLIDFGYQNYRAFTITGFLFALGLLIWDALSFARRHKSKDCDVSELRSAGFRLIETGAEIVKLEALKDGIPSPVIILGKGKFR